MNLKKICGNCLALTIMVSNINIYGANSITNEESYKFSIKDEVISSGAVDKDTSSDVVAYAVDGGNIYFDTATGTITDCDDMIVKADIPAAINNVSVVAIGVAAFNNCPNLSVVKLPDSITSIEAYAFDSCENLTDINIPDSVTYIGIGALSSTSITVGYIPSSLTSPFEDGLFIYSDCPNLTNFVVGKDNEFYTAIDGVLFNKDETELIAYPYGRTDTQYTVPNGTTVIGQDAFSNSGNLHNIILPASLTRIKDAAFAYCANLSSIAIPDNVSVIGKYAFGECTKLSAVTLPDSVTSIDDDIFYKCSGLSDVTLSKNISSLPFGTFEDCDSLDNVVIPENINTIGNYAFYSCDSLKTLTIENKNINIASNAFEDTKNISDIYLKGSEEDWKNFDLGIDMSAINIHYYSDSEPTATYTVRFISNRYDISIDNITVLGGNSIELPIPTNEGYVFKGWFKESTFDNEFTSTDKVETDLILYAKWNKLITLSFDSNGGSSVKDMYVEEGTSVMLPIPTKSGCTFGGWYLDSMWSNEYTDSTQAPQYDRTLYAKWIKTMPTESEITAKYKALDLSPVSTRFIKTPSLSAPYSAGKLCNNMVKNGLDYLNFVRFVEGLQPVSIDESKADLAQHGAVLLSYEYSHTPSQPSDMDDDFYNLGYEATSTSNIAWSYNNNSLSNLGGFVQLWLNDEDSSNMSRVGHRRWLLNPYMLTTAFGYVEKGANKYANVLAFDESNTDLDYYDFIAYPANGYFPNNLIDNTIPWSVSLNTSLYKVESRDDINIKITKKSNGQTWTISQSDYKSSPAEGDKYFNYNSVGYGINSCIIFSIGKNNISNNDLTGEFDVEITGLKDSEGNDTSINYTTTLFSISSSSNNTGTTSGSSTTGSTSSGSTSSSGGGGGGGGGSSSTTYYTITWNYNNDTTATENKVIKNKTLTKPSTPIKDGYTFTGWYTDSNCTKLYDFATKVTSSFTLYAGWEKIKEETKEETEEKIKENTVKDTKQSDTYETFDDYVSVTIGSNRIVINDKTYNIDVAPYIQTSSSSTLVPLRFVALAICGGNVDSADTSSIVTWDSSTKTATIRANNKVIEFVSGSNIMTVNGKTTVMDNGVEAEIKDSRMFIPFRALGKALDVDVDWDSETKTAIYQTK